MESKSSDESIQNKFRILPRSSSVPFRDSRGQILLITVMLIATILTVVLAVTFKSTTETQLTKLEEESQKALSAAEAGVELALQQGSIDNIGTLPEFSDTGITGNASVDSKLDTKFVSPLLKKDQQYTFYLADYPNFAQKYSGSVALYFQTEPDTCPSVEMTFLGSVPSEESLPLPPPPTSTPTPGAATATPTPTPPSAPTCVYTNDTSWKNTDFSSQTGSFTAEFEVTPNTKTVDSGDFGLSYNSANAVTDIIAGIRFNNAGYIKVLDGTSFVGQFPYNITKYRFRMVVDVPNHTYDVYVTPQGQTEQLLRSGNQFRTTVSELNNKTMHVNSTNTGIIYSCYFTISGAPAIPTSTPTPGSTSPIEIVSRNIIDPCSQISHSGEGIGSTLGEYSLGGYSFGYKSGAISISSQAVLVVRSLFASTRIGIESLDGQILPVQGKYVTSEARTKSGVSKKVELFQSYPQIPAEFFVTSF